MGEQLNTSTPRPVMITYDPKDGQVPADQPRKYVSLLKELSFPVEEYVTELGCHKDHHRIAILRQPVAYREPCASSSQGPSSRTPTTVPVCRPSTIHFPRKMKRQPPRSVTERTELQVKLVHENIVYENVSLDLPLQC